MTESDSYKTAALNNTLLFEQIEEAADFLHDHGFEDAQTGIVLGTGLGKLAAELREAKSMDYQQIPHFPESTVEFHSGKLLTGLLGGQKVIMMLGRMHCYEGYDAQTVAFPIRVLRALGVKNLLLSGAAGALGPGFKKGDLMLVTDHINLLPSNPLTGRNDSRLGPRFPAMDQAYAVELQDKIKATAASLNLCLKEGVYTSAQGPMLETAAEYRMLQRIGASAVGMSTTPEVIAARHAGMLCAAIIVLTDECDPDNLRPVDIGEIIDIANKAEGDLIRLMKSVIKKL